MKERYSGEGRVNRAYYLSHKDEIAAYKRGYNLVHRESNKIKKRNYDILHKKEIREYMLNYRIKNRERIQAYAKSFNKGYYDLNKEEIRLKSRLSRHNRLLEKSGREKDRKNKKDYRFLNRSKINGENRFRSLLTKELIQQVYELNIKKYGTLTCYLCSKSILFGEDNLEHKIPIIRGGLHTLDNMDVSHWYCNQIKGSRIFGEYRIEEFLNYKPISLIKKGLL